MPAPSGRRRRRCPWRGRACRPRRGRRAARPRRGSARPRRRRRRCARRADARTRSPGRWRRWRGSRRAMPTAMIDRAVAAVDHARDRQAHDRVEGREGEAVQQAHQRVVDAERLLDRPDQQGQDLPVHDREDVGEQQDADGVPRPSGGGGRGSGRVRSSSSVGSLGSRVAGVARPPALSGGSEGRLSDARMLSRRPATGQAAERGERRTGALHRGGAGDFLALDGGADRGQARTAGSGTNWLPGFTKFIAFPPSCRSWRGSCATLEEGSPLPPPTCRGGRPWGVRCRGRARGRGGGRDSLAPQGLTAISLDARIMHNACTGRMRAVPRDRKVNAARGAGAAGGRPVQAASDRPVADDSGALEVAHGGPEVLHRVVLRAAVVPDRDAVLPAAASAPGTRGRRPGSAGSSAAGWRRASSPARSARSPAVWKLVKCVVKALTNSTFSPVSGWVRTTGCSASGYCALSARRFSIGIAAPKVASMLCRARRSAICALMCSGRRS